MGKGAYLSRRFTDHIERHKVNLILELGSRDALDAIELSEHYDADVYSFECNPTSIPICKENIGDNSKVHLIEKAVWDEEGFISFYPVVNGNTGASSCFKAIKDYPYETDYEQEEITVSAIRLDGWLKERDISSVDLLCVDLQGAELTAFKGMGEYLHSVSYIITEGQTKPMYEGVNLIDEIESFLADFGFVKKTEKLVNPYFGDFLFVKVA